MSNQPNKSSPPTWAIRLFMWFCPSEFSEAALGDFLQQYDEDLETHSISKANRIFIWNVLRFFHPYILSKRRVTPTLMSVSMFKSHFLVALRSMKKYKFYASINILGLSFAISFVFLAFLFITNELKFDKFHTQKDSIYRIYLREVEENERDYSNNEAVTPIPLSKDLKEAVSLVEEYTRLSSHTATISIENRPFSESISFVDPGFFKMFDFPVIKGELKEAISQPNSMFLSSEKAIKFFGSEEALGQTVVLAINDTTLVFEVKGIIDNKSAESSISIDVIVPFERHKFTNSIEGIETYELSAVENYVLVSKEGHEQTEIESIFTEAIQTYISDDVSQQEVLLQPLTSIHLDDKVTGNASYTSPTKLYIMMALTALVMLIAGINFITLSTSHGLNRLKEMGVRKALGAVKGNLRNQLVLESFSITLISAMIGIAFAYYATPVFANLIESSMTFLLGWEGTLFLIIITLFIGLVTGMLQSIILVSLNGIQSMKETVRFSGYNSWFNRGLVVFQFSTSVLLIIGAITIRHQMSFIQNTELGFQKEGLIEIPMNSSGDRVSARVMLERFKLVGMQNPRITDLSASMNNSREPWTRIVLTQEDGSTESMYFNLIDVDYVEAMGLTVVEGTGFPAQANYEYSGILVNEALVKHFGWENPIGQQIPAAGINNDHKVVGVIKDFHYSSLHKEIEPLMLSLNTNNTVGPGITGVSAYVWPPNLYQLEVRFSPGEIQPVIAHLKSTWEQVNADNEFIYHFVDETVEAKYEEERRWSRIINIGSVFAILIAWVGLMGLMKLAVQKRTKEIGIRKVLGSSITEVILLFSKSFMGLVALGILMAWPIGWYSLNEWLKSFSYRIDLNFGWFIAAGLAVLIVTFITTGVQSLKAARSNPVDALKVE